MKSGNDRFREYVRRVMEVKGLTQKDVQHRSGRKITDSYVASILTGRAKNLSVEKIKALAQGLGVEAEDLFRVACGISEEPEAGGKVNTSDALFVLEVVREVVSNTDMFEMMSEALLLSPEERGIILRSIRAFNKAKQKPKRGRKSL